MSKFSVELSLNCTYEVDAPDEDTAVDIAYEWFNEAIPSITVEPMEDDENDE